MMFSVSLAASLLLTVKAYNLLDGLFVLSKPCFETIHDECCHTSIPDVFTPSHKSVSQNKPNTKVYLFTQKNQNKAEPLHRCGGKLPPNSDFDPNADTVVINHGWVDGVCRTAWMREMRNQLFIRGVYNVILVDWTWGNTFDLIEAAFNSFLVGEQLAFVLKNIMTEKNMNGDKIHLIGHSFGSYVASQAGKNIKKWRKYNKLKRITCLDPAVAPKGFLPPSKTISQEDAKFVDIIHGNGGSCFPFFFGNNQTLGHIDFYPNGGKVQPSCISYAYESFLKGDFIYGFGSLLVPQLCSHLQAIQFFKVSINPPAGLYEGVLCDSYADFLSGACKRCCKEDDTNCAIAGMDAEKYYKPSIRRGKYFFNTYNYCPFPEDYDLITNEDCFCGRK